jgi:hypothetical protein
MGLNLAVAVTSQRLSLTPPTAFWIFPAALSALPGLQLSITKHLAGDLLGFAFDLLRRSFDPIFVHDFILQGLAKPLTGEVAMVQLSFSFGLRAQVADDRVTIWTNLLKAQL